MNYEALSAAMIAKVRQWHEGQSGQEDMIEYERSLVKAVQEIGQIILQEAVGTEQQARSKKK